MATTFSGRDHFAEAKSYDEAERKIDSRRDVAVKVTRPQRRSMILMDEDYFEAMQESIVILNDDSLMADIKRGIEDLKRGDTISWDDAQEELDW